ncbi:MAG: outer membrane beta-barrel protein [Rubrivivax sp.]
MQTLRSVFHPDALAANPMKSLHASVHALALASTLAMLGAAAPAAAQTAPERYVGGSLGALTRYDLDCGAGVRCDRTPSGSGKVMLGLPRGKNFGAERIAWRLSSGDGRVKLGTGTGTGAGTVRSQGVAAVGVFTMPLVDQLSAKARLGVGHVRGEVDYAAGGSSRRSKVAPVFGVGLSYALSPQWSLQADWDRLPTRVDGRNKVNADLVSVGVSFHF